MTVPLSTANPWDQLDAVMQSFIDQGQCAGMVYMIRQGDTILHRAARGAMELGAPEPMRTDAIFRIQSLTKPITAAAIMALVEDGALHLDDPVGRFIPAVDKMEVLVDPADPRGDREPQQRPITVRDLLTNTSGLAYGIFTDAPIEELYREAELVLIPTADLLSRLPDLPLAFQPGAGWRYGIGFDLLGHIVATVTDRPFGDFLEERFFGPLGMGDTGFCVPATSADRLTGGHSNPTEGPLALWEPAAACPWLEPDHRQSGGSDLVSTISDYERFLRMLSGGGALDGVRVLQPATTQALVTNHLPDALQPIFLDTFTFPGSGYGYGLGVCTDTTPWTGGARPGTFWWLGYFGTYAWVDPALDLIGLYFSQHFNYHEASITFQNLVYQGIA